MIERLEAYDLGALYWFTYWRGPWLNAALVFLTRMGDFLVVLAVVLAGAALLWLFRRPRLACVFLLAALIGLGIEWGMKVTIGRPRPNVNTLIEPPASPSFPSGHAMMTMAVYGALAILVRRLDRSLGTALLVGAGMLSIVVGITRVMVGVHYPFDVVAGWLGGLACVALAHGLVEALEKTPEKGELPTS